MSEFHANMALIFIIQIGIIHQITIIIMQNQTIYSKFEYKKYEDKNIIKFVCITI
jgi:hypothetical protein